METAGPHIESQRYSLPRNLDPTNPLLYSNLVIHKCGPRPYGGKALERT